MKSKFRKYILILTLSTNLIFSLLATSQDKQKAQGYFEIGMQSFESYDTEKAKEYFTKAIKEDAKFVQAYYKRALVYEFELKYDSMISDLTNILEVDPDNFEARKKRGQVYCDNFYNLHQYENSLSDFNYLINKFPNDLSFYIARSICYEGYANYCKEAGNFTCFIENISNGIKDLELIPRESEDYRSLPLVQIYYARAEYYFEQAIYEKAKDDFDKIIEAMPDGGFYKDRGICYLKLNLNLNAYNDFRRYTEFDSKDSEGYMCLGLACYELERYKESVTNLEIAFELGQSQTNELKNILNSAKSKIR